MLPILTLTAASVTTVTATRVGQTGTEVQVTVSDSDVGCTSATEFYVTVDGTAESTNPTADGNPFTIDTSTDCRDATIEVWYANPDFAPMRGGDPPYLGTSATANSGE